MLVKRKEIPTNEQRVAKMDAYRGKKVLKRVVAWMLGRPSSSTTSYVFS